MKVFGTRPVGAGRVLLLLTLGLALSGLLAACGTTVPTTEVTPARPRLRRPRRRPPLPRPRRHPGGRRRADD